MYFYQTGSPAAPFGGAAEFPLVASGLSYGDWHSVDLYIDFEDGLDDSGSTTLGNDVVSVLVDGDLVHTGTTWETFYHDNNPAGLGSGTQIQAVDSLLFRLAGTAAPGTDGNGFHVDDVVIDNAGLDPQTKEDCKNGGWAIYGFKNQGQCIRFVNTGKDPR